MARLSNGVKIMKKNETIIKKGIDVALSAAMLALLSPIMLITALLIKLDSDGPVFFVQERVGKDKKLFNLYKFRTMKLGAEKEGLGYDVEENDSRITFIGNFLRRWCLDEVPQLFNVLKGNMSIVGPRPTLKYQVDNYTDADARRLEVKPGMTGLAQVRGRNLLSWSEKIKYDVEYIDNYSTGLDFKIMLETVGLIIKSEGVYKNK